MWCLHEISEARASTSSMYERQSIARLVSGKLSKKYRLNLAISKGTGICRKTLTKVSTKRVRPDRRICAVKQLALDVEDFMSREDNSRMQPGKGDAIKISKGEKKQTIILTNYLADLHKKFSAENPQVKISLATFCRLRPRHILTAKFISRTSCLCIKHQNMALKCQTLKKYNIFVRENPEHLIGQSLEIERSMDQLLENRVAYRVWKQVVVEDKKKMKIIENTVEKNEFIEMMKVEMNQFASHVDRVRCQYREIKTLKDSLKEKEVLVQMDFAENYSCKSLAEVQSAYWNQTPVTIHPVVVYFRGQSKLEHKSIAIISDELSHCTSTVCTFLDSLVPVLKEICPNVEFVHYWTDSPSSQYRNKTIFDLIANHSSVYGIQARWNYFEAGHGKGPCDGLGGTIKRMADEAVKRGAVVIQDPKEFFDWSTTSNMKEVKFLFVKKEECKKKLDQLNKIKLRPIKGTMKFHAVAYDLQTAELCTRETSCYCGICLKGKFCESWSRQTYDGHSNDTSHTKETVNQNELQESNEIQNEDFHEIIIVEVSVDDFIACVYEGQWYIGENFRYGRRRCTGYLSRKSESYV
ncbi:Hypothetical predicted protein [Mytilus galloprovincialis]|uniref:Uncharacterized protein n=1 Tax=Mytilus galloprovincialis TaxID=29158 RepID=A0A8B6EK74_MYTGA|nr:Hypothetical predicted protein [Mytilus galloprovincialis]